MSIEATIARQQRERGVRPPRPAIKRPPVKRPARLSRAPSKTTCWSFRETSSARKIRTSASATQPAMKSWRKDVRFFARWLVIDRIADSISTRANIAVQVGYNQFDHVSVPASNLDDLVCGPSGRCFMLGRPKNRKATKPRTDRLIHFDLF